VLCHFVLLGWAIWLWEVGIKLLASKFTLMDVIEEIEVIVKKVCKPFNQLSGSELSMKPANLQI